MEDDQKQPENVELRSEEDELEDYSSDSSDASDDSQIRKRSKTMWGRKSSGAHDLAMTRGKELRENLTKKDHSFIKQMEWSHVKEFVLDVPTEFCRSHLPAHNVEVILEDESGKGYAVEFIAGTEGTFENGWKRFSDAHKLLESDVVVFHLIRPCYFKVYIIRAVDPTGVGSTNLTSLTGDANEGTKESKCEAADRNGFRFASVPDSVQGSANRSSLLSSPSREPGSDHPSMEEFHSTCMDISGSSERAAETAQESVKKSSVLSNSNLEPVPDHPSAEEFHSTNMEISAISEHAVDTVQEGDKRSSLLSDPNLEPGPDHPSAEEFQSSDMEISASSECATETVQGIDKMDSLLKSPLEPGQDHPNVEVFHSSDMEVPILSERAADVEGHKDPENVKVQAVEEKEKDLSDPGKVQKGEEEVSSNSSCMVISKPPSPNSNIPSSSTKVSSRSRKKTDKQVAYDNNHTSKSCMKKRGITDSEAHALAWKRAEELRTNLSNEHPSFMKQMMPSNVTKCFELTLPAGFCHDHLPKQDADVTMEDESGESYVVNFRPRKAKRFHGGWIRFLEAHNLLEGDVLVFHLLRPCYFKVYIVRVNEPTVVGNASLTSSNLHAKEGTKKRKFRAADGKACKLSRPGDATVQGSLERKSVVSKPSLTSSNLHANEGTKKRKFRAADGKARKLSRPMDATVQGSVERRSVGSKPGLEPECDRSSSEELHSSDVEACQLSGRCPDFEKFKIIVNGTNIDEELSRPTRFKYYKLCCSRKSYLHKNILKSVHREFAVGIITGTLKMADAIRGSKLPTSKDDFASWEKCLEGFASFGMDVGFLLDRLRRLATAQSEFRGKVEVEKYEELKNNRCRMREETRSHEMKLLELKEAAEKVEDEMKTLKGNILKHKDAFKQEANAPW